MRQVAYIERDGQTRGMTPLAPVIESVKQLTRYGGAELDAAVATSFISLIIENEEGGTLGLPGMGTGANPAVGFPGRPGVRSW
jgi:capsid protein